MARSHPLRTHWLLALALALGACGGGLARFPLRSPLATDDDRQPFGPRPEERWVPYYWDAMDNLVFRPLAEAPAFETSRPALNVNALDEVPDSSWFVNRIGRSPMTPEEVARGACDPAFDAPGPWTVVGGKPSGASPGLIIEDANGVRYLLKTDRAGQPERSTAADAIVAALFHAAGYHVPCNRVAFFEDESMFVLGEGASQRSPSGSRRPITRDDVERVVQAAAIAPDGRRRVLLSRFIEGQPLGPWSYTGTWDEDPNDVIPHERRREVRGTYVIDAWVDHWDARQENTLASWIERGGGGYVRHYLVDFGEALGMERGNHRQAPRMGHSTFFDLGHIAEDALTFGIVSRPWDSRTRAPILGYFSASPFDPERWRPQYWNGALERRTEEDCAWMARVLARFTRAHLEAAAALGQYSDPATAEQLTDILLARRDALLRRYFAQRSPLADVTVSSSDGRPRVCATDLAVRAGIARASDRRAGAAAYVGRALEPRPVALSRDEDMICATLPPLSGSGRPDDYVVIDLHVRSAGLASGPLRVHLYAVGPSTLSLVGLERPPSAAPPRP